MLKVNIKDKTKTFSFSELKSFSMFSKLKVFLVQNGDKHSQAMHEQESMQKEFSSKCNNSCLHHFKLRSSNVSFIY